MEASLDFGLNRIAAEVEIEHRRLMELRAEKARELHDVEEQLRRAERALKVLRPEEWGVSPGRPKKRAKGEPTTRVGGERRALIESAITDLLQQQEEIRQADVVKKTGIRSGPVSMVFADLRKSGVIRLARVDKPSGSRYFKLVKGAKLNGVAV